MSDKMDTNGADCGHVRNVSATERLCELLDERGVKWWPMRNNGYYEDRDTEFVANGKKHTAHEWGDGLAVYNLTPEQAIAATLGEQRDTADIDELLDEFEHECFMIRVEASETGARDGVVRKAYKRQREETAKAIAAILGSGKLTAEQVRDAVMSADRWEKPMGNTGLTNTHLIIRDDGWQAIADELNAALGGGEPVKAVDREDGEMT